jgi:hypothetical protein
MDSRLLEQITRDMLGDKLIDGNIAGDGSDHIISIFPRLGDGIIKLMPVGLGKSHQVEPVTCKMLGVCTTLQQSVDHDFPGFYRPICEEGLELPWRRGQSGEVKSDPPQPGAIIGVCSRLQAKRVETGTDEQIEWITGPLIIHHLG